ncbi:MAG: RrF2 family transcriptional regulator [Anaerolineales bacterium]|jgi:Rrf2 family protein
MEITRQADYAIRAILYLAENEKKGRAPTNLIASAKHIPPSFLAKIISQLSVAGLVNTSRGARGGVTLSRPSDEITLLEVIEAIDGPISINECALDLSVCEFGKTCLVGPVWCKLQEELVSRLKAVTFRQLVKEPTAVDSSSSAE